MMTAREAARWWIERYQMLPVPAPWMQKGPVVKGWPELRLTAETVDQYFNGEPQNIALLMGAPKNLADVDKDCPEAYWAWKEFGPPTGLKWGRRSNPDSHALYYTEPAAASAKYLDPVLAIDQPGDACLIELRCLTKDGRVGNPVVAPPSRHPTGEDYEFAGGAGFPASLAGPLLETRVRLTAAAAMLARHAREGLRHEIFLALAGAFARAKWELAEAQRFLRGVYRVLWREAANLRQADADADSTYQKHDDGGEVTGLTKLGTLIDERAFRQLKKWLDLESLEEWTRQQPPPEKKPRVLPVSYPLDSLRTEVVPMAQKRIDKVFYGPGLTMVVGESKSGKTVLAVQMLLCCANKLHFLDNYVTAQSNGLIIEWDDQQGKASLQEFVLKTRASREGMPVGYSIKQEDQDLDFTLSDPEFIPWLKALIEKHQAGVVVLDSYTALRGFHGSGRDIVKVEAGELLLLHRLATEMNCAILLIHHTSKTSAHLDRHSRAAGTYAMQAVSEAQIVVERYRELSEEDPMRLVSVRGRHLAGLQMALRFNEETLDFDLVLEGPAAEEFPRLRHLLQSFRGRSFTAPDVTKEIGWAKTQVYALMSRLLASGIVSKDGTTWMWNDAWKRTLERI